HGEELIMVDCQGWDSFHYLRALNLLIRYSLLTAGGGRMARVTMHGLVRWRAKKHQPDRPWDLWVSICLRDVPSGRAHIFSRNKTLPSDLADALRSLASHSVYAMVISCPSSMSRRAWMARRWVLAFQVFCALCLHE